MFRAILIVLMVVTILMPRRFYRRYMQIMAALAVLFITLIVIAYEENPGDASSKDVYVMVGFISMNATIVITKYLLLRSTKQKPQA